MRVRLIVPIAAAVLLAHAPAANAAEVIAYECTTTGVTQPQEVKINVELTVPRNAAVDENLTIGWKGTYADGTQLLAPTTGLENGLKLYVYVGISGLDRLTSATGVGQLGTITAGSAIVLPTTTVNLTTTPQEEGEGTVHAAAINLGPSPQDPLIECEVKDTTALTEYPLKVGTGTGTSPSPTPTPDATETDEDEDASPTPAPTVTVTKTTTKTPAGGADTGGGGEAGPDGRALLLAGSLLLLTAGAGLWLRRPRRIQ